MRLRSAARAQSYTLPRKQAHGRPARQFTHSTSPDDGSSTHVARDLHVRSPTNSALLGSSLVQKKSTRGAFQIRPTRVHTTMGPTMSTLVPAASPEAPAAGASTLKEELERHVLHALAQDAGLPAEQLDPNVIVSQLVGQPSALLVSATVELRSGNSSPAQLVTACAVGMQGTAALDVLRGLTLHWGCSTTPSGRDGGISFVLKTAAGAWMQCQLPGGGRGNFFVQAKGSSPMLEGQQPPPPPQQRVDADKEVSQQTDHEQQQQRRQQQQVQAQGREQERQEQEQKLWEEAKRASSRRQSTRRGDPAVLHLLSTFQWKPYDAALLLEEVEEAAEAQSHSIPGAPNTSAWCIEAAAAEESGAERSLMHRYDAADNLLMRILEKDTQGGHAKAVADLAVLTVWLRFSAARRLTWNRNYNIKPREISAAQDRLNTSLSRAYTERSHLRQLLLIAMVAVGRGGHGDVGQRIRDEILAVQQRNNCKGGMMEEWHQKLHNNTSPDDVDICRALLNYCAAGCDITAYWRTLHEAGITSKRLASFDRPIKSEPRFQSHQVPGLVRDLTAYLKTLRAVHSGADLASAAANVLGYSETDMKGKTVTVPPLEPVASLPSLRPLIAAILHLQQQRGGPYVPPPADPDHGAGRSMLASVEEDEEPSGVAMAIGASAVAAGSEVRLQSVLKMLQLIVEARRHLQPAIRGGDEACGGRLRDVLFLDQALDTAARSTLEADLIALRAAVQPLLPSTPGVSAVATSSSSNSAKGVGASAHTDGWAKEDEQLVITRPALLSRLLQLLATVTEGVALSSHGGTTRRELVHCLKWLDALTAMTDASAQRDRMLQALAVIDRLKRCLSDGAEGLMATLLPPAIALGEKLKLEAADAALIGEEAARGGGAAPLAQLLGILEPALRRATGSGDWQIISRGPKLGVVGRLRVEAGLGAVQYETCAKPTILLIQHLTGHEEIPQGCVAVLVADNCPDVLSHSAVRARNLGVLLAGCYSDQVSTDIRAMAGKVISVTVNGPNVVIEDRPGEAH